MRLRTTSFTVCALIVGLTVVAGQQPQPESGAQAPPAAPGARQGGGGPPAPGGAGAPAGRQGGRGPAAPPIIAQGPPAPFYEHVVAQNIRGGYQVTAVDMNKDGRIDLIGLGSAATDLVWYENPYWTPHVIVSNMPRMINVGAGDMDKDGIPELALAYEFSTNAAQSLGKIAILKANGDPKGRWTVKEVDAIPTSHRVRAGNIGGQMMFVNAPIQNVKAPPGFQDPEHTSVPLRVYRPPDYKPETVTEENRGATHGLAIGDWDGDNRQDILTAAFNGIFVHSPARNGSWTRTELGKGDPSPWPLSGASEIALGTLNKKRFYTTIEPFHGDQVVVYRQAADGTWPRQVIEKGLWGNGHALVMLDIDGDGTDEIVAGGTRAPAGSPQGAKPGVFVFKATDSSAEKWERMVLDGRMAPNSCVVADINGDKKPDVACIDDTLKWYENSRP